MINLWSFLLETIYLEIAIVSYCYICFGFFLTEFFTFPILFSKGDSNKIQ